MLLTCWDLLALVIGCGLMLLFVWLFVYWLCLITMIAVCYGLGLCYLIVLDGLLICLVVCLWVLLFVIVCVVW